MARRPHRPKFRPLPGRDLTWPSAALPAQTVAGADIAEPGTVPDNLRSFQVGVARRRGGYEAYTRFAPGMPDACVHHVSASSGAEAKALGIAAHIKNCLHGGAH